MSTLTDYTTDTDDQRDQRDRTRGHDAPALEDIGHVANGDRLRAITYDGLRYYFAERNRTTLELRSIERTDEESAVPTEVVGGCVYEDLPALVRKTLKLEGYRMIARNGFLSGAMS